MPRCPAPGTKAQRSDGTSVDYLGLDNGRGETCRLAVAGAQQSSVDGIWPANWPGSARASAALQRVLAGGPGSQDSFSLSEDVESLNFVTTSETWRFTLTNEGTSSLMVNGAARPVTKLRWQEQDLAHPYRGNAEIALDQATGAVLSQEYRTEIGSANTGYEFWSKYGGGLSAVPAFRVTALQPADQP